MSRVKDWASRPRGLRLRTCNCKSVGAGHKTRELSEVVRLGAGSASRSLAGAFSIWYANRNGRSYAEELASPGSIKMRTVIVPIESEIKTDRAHADAVKSPFFKPRLVYLRSILPRMKRAIWRNDVESIEGWLKRILSTLHAVTMTGKEGLILLSPLSIEIIREVRRLRTEESVPVWFFSRYRSIGICQHYARRCPVSSEKSQQDYGHILVSDPGGPAEIIDKHLFLTTQSV